MDANITADAEMRSRILDFLTVLYRCFQATTHTEDRTRYAADMATATGWMIMLHEGEQLENVAAVICSPATTKQFTDYWKQGEWGEQEAYALTQLQREAESVLSQL